MNILSKDLDLILSIFLGATGETPNSNSEDCLIISLDSVG